MESTSARTEQMRDDVVAVIPAYRCEATIAGVVAGVREHLDRVVVVDDGSEDRTGTEAARAGADVVAFERNRGKGQALLVGIERALEENPGALLLLDGDGQHAPADVPRLLEAWDSGRADLVIGTRLADREAIPPARYWTNTIGSRILSWMTGYRLEDSQSGFRLLATDLLRRIELRSTGYAVESEMLIKAAKAQARLVQVPVTTIYEEGGSSHFRPFLDTLRISWWSVYYKAFG